MGKVVVWYSKYEPNEAQIKHLRNIYGEDVTIRKVKRRFESEEQFLRYIKRNKADAVYAVLPLEIIKRMMETDIGKGVDWLWAEFVEMKDGVRSEMDANFDPSKDSTGYFFGFGQHRRFIGFSKIKDYQLVREPLEDFEKVEEEIANEESYEELYEEAKKEMVENIKDNKTLIVMVNSTKYSDKDFVSVQFNKGTAVFEQLRPMLKEMGFTFNSKKKQWEGFVVKDKKEEFLKAYREVIVTVLENMGTLALQKRGLPENLTNRLVKEALSETKGMVKLRDFTKDEDVGKDSNNKGEKGEVEM